MEESNFIYSNTSGHPQPQKRSSKKRGLLWYGTATVVFCLVITFFVTAFGVGKFVSGVSGGQQALAAAETSAINFDIPAAKESLVIAKEDFSSARDGLKWLGWMRPVPWLGSQFKAVSTVMDAGIEALAALQEATDIATEVTDVLEEAQLILSSADVPEEEFTFENFPDETKEKLLLSLQQQHNRLAEMQVRLELSKEHLESLDDIRGVSPFILNTIDPFRELLPNLISGVDVLVPLSASIGELSGIGEEKQWLILFLNNTEMRPAGGFMGVFGLMTVMDAEIQSMNVADTYSIDKQVENNSSFYSPAPQPLTQYTQVEKMYFRDANWSPDFPTSASVAASILQNEIQVAGQPAPHLDGVIGFTPTFAESLLELIGSVSIDGVEFTHENVTELLEFEVEFGYEDRGIDFDARKVIVGKLTEEVLAKIYSLPVTQWGDLFNVIENSIQEKQLAFYSFDEETQAAFKDAGWTSGIELNNSDDYLMVVDANMHALKTDASIERSIDYRIVKEGDDYIATTSIHYTHFGTYDLFTSDYKTYTRVYAPLGSEIISVNHGEVRVEDDLGMTSFGAYLEVKPGVIEDLVFSYKLPATVREAIDENIYQLTVFKQMGADNYALTLDLDFGKKVRAAEPAEEQEHFSDTKYNLNTNLAHDTSVTVQF